MLPECNIGLNPAWSEPRTEAYTMENSLHLGPLDLKKNGITSPLLWAGLAFSLLALLAAWMLLGSQAVPQPVGAPGNLDRLAQQTFIDQTGVRIVLVALSAGGGMIDLRYQVIDPDKALIVHDEDTPITIIDEASGAALKTLWMDHGHERELHAGVTYPNLILNVGGVLKPGSRVMIAIGDARLEGVIVQ